MSRASLPVYLVDLLAVLLAAPDFDLDDPVDQSRIVCSILFRPAKDL